MWAYVEIAVLAEERVVAVQRGPQQAVSLLLQRLSVIRLGTRSAAEGTSIEERERALRLDLGLREGIVVQRHVHEIDVAGTALVLANLESIAKTRCVRKRGKCEAQSCHGPGEWRNRRSYRERRT